MITLSPTRHLTGRRSALASLVTTGLLFVALLVPGPDPASALGFSPLVDAPSEYVPQTTCSKAPQPGTTALAHWLMRSYPGTGSLGMMRACTVGGTSEHKDGRAFDWAADIAKPKTRKAAFDFIAKLLATDAAGNTHALARRLGIMYFIYNDTLWASYRDFAPRPYLNPACPSKKKCSRSLRHLNHVHISLGPAGAAAQTSWYRARNIASTPVLYPGSHELDPDGTAVTGLTVAASGKPTVSPYRLRAGVTYRVVVTGTLSYANGATGDANCIAGSPGWIPTDRVPVDVPFGREINWYPSGGTGSTHADSPSALPALTTHGLLLGGGLLWGEACQPNHTYEAWFTPIVTQPLQLAYVGATGGSGTLTAYVARDDITATSLARK